MRGICRLLRCLPSGGSSIPLSLMPRERAMINSELRRQKSPALHGIYWGGRVRPPPRGTPSTRAQVGTTGKIRPTADTAGTAGPAPKKPSQVPAARVPSAGVGKKPGRGLRSSPLETSALTCYSRSFGCFRSFAGFRGSTADRRSFRGKRFVGSSRSKVNNFRNRCAELPTY